MANRVVVQGLNPRMLEISAVVIRADGTREDRGIICYWHKNPLRRLAFRMRRKSREPSGSYVTPLSPQVVYRP